MKKIKKVVAAMLFAAIGIQTSVTIAYGMETTETENQNSEESWWETIKRNKWKIAGGVVASCVLAYGAWRAYSYFHSNSAEGVGAAQLPAQGKYQGKPKDYCEDRIVIVNKPGYHYKAYAVFDGHGGDETVKLLEKYYPSIMEDVFSQLKESSTDKEVADAITQAYRKLDAKIKGAGGSGATATALIEWNNKSIIANTGDSRTALLLPNGTVFASQDHKPRGFSECARIKKDGGFIKNGRVGGILALSRAFGDRENGKKIPGIIVDPQVKVIGHVPAGTLGVIASDGLWDTLGMRKPVLTTGNYLKALQHELASGISVNRLAQQAVRKAQDAWLGCAGGYVDDISAIIVKF